ncbi:MAG: type II toxin-antitoxin system HicA family toxin [Nanoarchaeota archaeon]|nr:type II toxin-antitoxin system HicA family toxin [Nanoarchaeota archaeon]
MSRLPLISAKELTRVLEKLNFKFIRQEGSHMFFKHPDGRTTVIPNHPKEDIGSGLLLKIIKKDLQITREEFERLL